MCEMQMGGGRLAFSNRQYIQIVSQVLILHRLWGWCLVQGDVLETRP